MPTFYEELESLNDYKVTIRNSKTGEVLEGLIDNEEISYSAGANIGESTLAGLSEGFSKGVIKGVVSKALGDLGKNIVSDNFKTVLSTFKGYEDSKPSTFSVSLHLFPNKFNNPSYKEMVEILGRMTQPNTEDGKFIRSYLYSPEDTKKLAKGEDPFEDQLIHVMIGNWFFAKGLFMTSGPITMSKYVDTSGKPIYSKVDLDFESYKVLNAREWASWWRQ